MELLFSFSSLGLEDEFPTSMDCPTSGCHKNYQRRIVEEATRVMHCIANRLKLAQQHIDSAVMFYKMALR